MRDGNVLDRKYSDFNLKETGISYSYKWIIIIIIINLKQWGVDFSGERL